jgi:cyclopropane fatty-acyl-phospholipid synthase-like methyltransferase
MNEELARWGGIPPGGDVLDSGCGIGGSALWLARQRGCRVLGITLSSEQRELATAAALDAGLQDRVRFEVRDFTRTGLEPESFDAVWALESSCYAREKGRLVAECFRLLRPGGRLVLADGFLRDRLVPRELAAAAATCLVGWSVPNLATVDDLRTALHETGFEAIRCRDLSANVRRSSRKMERWALLGAPLSRLLHLAGARTAGQDASLVAAARQGDLFRRDAIRYCAFAARRPPARGAPSS